MLLVDLLLNSCLIIANVYIMEGSYAHPYTTNTTVNVYITDSLLLKVYKASNFYAYITLSTVFG